MERLVVSLRRQHGLQRWSIQLNSPNANPLYTFLYNCLHNNFKAHPSHLLADRSFGLGAIQAGYKKRTTLYEVAPVDVEVNLMH